MSNSCKLSSLIQNYISINKRIVQSTADLNGRAFRELVDLAGDVDADQITPDDAELFQAYLIEKGLSKTSANILVASASPVFNWALKKNIIEKNPFAELKKFKIARRPVSIYEPGEIRRLMEIASDLWKARILLGLSTLRRGEVLNLTIKDIDFQNQTVQITPKIASGYTWPWQPKDCETRIVPIIPRLAELLMKIAETLPKGQPYICITPQRYEFLKMKGVLKYRWCSNPENNFERNFRFLLKRAMISGKVFHDLRKTGLTLLSDGMRSREIMEIAGHSNLKTTEKYLGIRKDRLSRARELLDLGV
ncbi:MAG TPA: hypothetical protein DC049_07980 [Spirochaetia bacterium]|nr:hypothetical protein [Spirochaetia bacterium]